jgi:hypothetical protein
LRIGNVKGEQRQNEEIIEKKIACSDTKVACWKPARTATAKQQATAGGWLPQDLSGIATPAT